MRYRRKWYTKLMMAVLIGLALLWTLMPVYIIVSNSMRRTLEMKEMPPKLLFAPTWTHFEKVLTLDRFGQYFLNSVIITGSVVLLTIWAGSLAAYGLKICKSKSGRNISSVLLLGKMVPVVTIMIPLFIMFNRVHLTGLHLAPILAHCILARPFVASRTNSWIGDSSVGRMAAGTGVGISGVVVFSHKILPLLKPAVASAAILVMQSSWNELLFALTLTGIKTYPLTVGIAKYVGALSVDWGKCSAAATLTMLPVILVGFFMQKYLVSGMTAGAVKG